MPHYCLVHDIWANGGTEHKGVELNAINNSVFFEREDIDFGRRSMGKAAKAFVILMGWVVRGCCCCCCIVWWCGGGYLAVVEEVCAGRSDTKESFCQKRPQGEGSTKSQHPLSLLVLSLFCSFFEKNEETYFDIFKKNIPWISKKLDA